MVIQKVGKIISLLYNFFSYLYKRKCKTMPEEKESGVVGMLLAALLGVGFIVLLPTFLTKSTLRNAEKSLLRSFPTWGHSLVWELLVVPFPFGRKENRRKNSRNGIKDIHGFRKRSVSWNVIPALVKHFTNISG